MWGEPLELWLCHIALGVSSILLAGVLAMRLVRQPALRRFIGNATFVACAVLGLASVIPGLPRWPLLPVPNRSVFDLGVLRGDPAGPTAQAVKPGIAGTLAPGTGATAVPISWRHVILMGYLGGASLMALRLLLGLGLTFRVVRHSSMPSDHVGRLWKRLQGDSVARLRVAEQLSQPVVAGTLRMTVLLPPALCEPSHADELEAALLHELAHARARDTRMVLLAGLLRVGLYVHPLYWLVWRDLRLSQEMLADAWAARRLGSAAGYAERLVHLAQRPLPFAARLLPVLQAIRRRSEFYQRMDFLLRRGDSIHMLLSRRTALVVSCAVTLLTVLGAVVTFGHSRSPAADQHALDATILAQRNGVTFLLGQQERSGGWLTQTGPGVTALTLQALLQSGQSLDSPPVRRALDYIQSTRHADGGFYVEGQPTYNTAIVISALAQLPGNPYRQQVEEGRQFLASLQKPVTAGTFYAAITKPPAMRDPLLSMAGQVPTHDSQDLVIRSPGDRTDEAFLTNRRQLTYAQFKSLLYAGLTREDPRVRALLLEAKADFTLQTNPLYGQPHGQFYYYYILSKTLRASGTDVFADTAGTSHNWRTELTTRLVALQSPNGSWINEQSDYWLENNPVLVTTYCVLALQEARP